jgi:predicted helicase
VISLYRYTTTGERLDNITDWALNKFTRYYGKRAGVSKDAIFHYVYACLHDPVWRETYAINLRREFPRVPFQDDFAQWAAWGGRLMDLHINYETVDPWTVNRTDEPDEKSRTAGVPLPVKLKAHPEEGRIEIDSETTLTGFPPEVWDYKLGNRSGLDWVLDQNKEKKVRDATVEAWLKDNPDCRYRFADHKERVIDLLARVARVSVETLEIVAAMRTAPRSWLTEPPTDR